MVHLFLQLLFFTIPHLLVSSDEALASTGRTLEVRVTSCLRVRTLGRRPTGACLPSGQQVEWTGERRGSYLVVRLNGQRVLLYSRHLQNVSTSSRGEQPPQARTADVAERTTTDAVRAVIPNAGSFPSSGNLAQRRSWLYGRLSYWIRQYGSRLLSSPTSDMGQFCPNYSSLNQDERVNVWASIIAEMSVWENGSLNPRSTYQESFDNSTGQRVISTGLFQISIESTQGYRCGFTAQSQLLDPDRNAACAVRMVNQLVNRDGVFANGSSNSPRGASRYWAVLRNSTQRNRQAYAAIKAAGRAACSNPQAAPGGQQAPVQVYAEAQGSRASI